MQSVWANAAGLDILQSRGPYCEMSFRLRLVHLADVFTAQIPRTTSILEPSG